MTMGVCHKGIVAMASRDPAGIVLWGTVPAGAYHRDRREMGAMTPQVLQPDRRTAEVNRDQDKAIKAVFHTWGRASPTLDIVLREAARLTLFEIVAELAVALGRLNS
jgi:hypothetical protein